jgi:hypothetical protein
LITSIRVLIGQSFSGDGRCERADDLPAQQLIKIRDIGTDQDDDSTMKPLMGMAVFSLPASSPTGVYETFRISQPFSTGKGHEFIQNHTIVVPRKLNVV